MSELFVKILNVIFYVEQVTHLENYCLTQQKIENIIVFIRSEEFNLQSFELLTRFFDQNFAEFPRML